MTPRLLAPLLVALSLCAWPGTHAVAQALEVKQFSVEPLDAAYIVSADFELELGGRLEEALNGGVPLSFVVEFELTRPRWYWFDEKAAAGRLDARLSYNPLLRQYRITTAQLQRNFFTLSDAMAALTQVRTWPVIERERVQGDTIYIAALRMRLDTAQLPKPFQISAITDRDWALASPWKRIAFTAAEAGRAAR
jgi:hypothetical protein